MTCTPAVESALDALLQDALATETARLALLSAQDRVRLQQTIGAMQEVLHVAFVFFAGFQDAAAGGKVLTLMPPATVRWVHHVDRRRSGGMIAGPTASGICGLLEGYIVAMTPVRVTAGRIAALRAAGLAKKDDASTLKDLSRRVKPTSNQEPAAWVRALGEAFEVALDSAEERALIDLIAHRNRYSHDPGAAVQDSLAGEDIKCWVLAAIHLCHRIGAPAVRPTA